MEPIFECKGTNGQLQIFREKVVILRKGPSAFLYHGVKGDKTLFLKDITAIRFREASFWAGGEIEFSVPGSHDKGPFVGSSAYEDHTIIFGKSENEQFSWAKLKLDQLIADLSISAPAASGTSVADEIGRLGDLRSSGALDEEEFLAAKQQVLRKSA